MKSNDTARASVETSNEISIPERLRTATELLEAVAKDRSLLAKLSVEERTRLLAAAGEIYSPDVSERRRLVKARVRQRKAEKLQRDQSKLNETGIRALRRKTVFTTPNVFPPENFEQREVEGDAEFREVVEPQNCYICKKRLFDDSSFLRSALPAVRGVEFPQAH